MMKRIAAYTLFPSRTLAASLAIASLALAVAFTIASLVVATTQAQSGVPEQGLPARYIAAYTGAGVVTDALLGPFCKSASASGNTLSIVCEDDDDPSNADATTTFTPTDVSVSSVALAGTTATFTKSDSSTFDLNLSTLGGGGGGGGNTEAIVGVTYDHTTNTFTFTQAGGGTIICRIDVDCPTPASQTIYVAIRQVDATFAPGDFTSQTTGATATGRPRLGIELPDWDSCEFPEPNPDYACDDPRNYRYIAWALPAALALTDIDAPYTAAVSCEPFYEGDPPETDCTQGTDVTISSDLYKYYVSAERQTYEPGSFFVNWSE